MNGAYVVEEDIARRWLADLIVAAEMDELEPFTGDVAAPLIRQAQHPVGALAGPPHTHVTVQYIDDGDDWAYQHLLHFAAPAPLTVAARPLPVTRLGGGHGYGLDAALAVLREAAETANDLLHRLAAFGAPR
jgi:hypothetical protein